MGSSCSVQQQQQGSAGPAVPITWNPPPKYKPEFPLHPLKQHPFIADAHENFLEVRRRWYLPRPFLEKELDVKAENNPAVCVMGPAGIGKSSLLAYWVQRCRARNPSDIVIFRSFGAANDSLAAIDVLRSIILELHWYADQASDPSSDLPSDPDPATAPVGTPAGLVATLPLDRERLYPGSSLDLASLLFLPHTVPPCVLHSFPKLAQANTPDKDRPPTQRDQPQPVLSSPYSPYAPRMFISSGAVTPTRAQQVAHSGPASPTRGSVVLGSGTATPTRTEYPALSSQSSQIISALAKVRDSAELGSDRFKQQAANTTSLPRPQLSPTRPGSASRPTSASLRNQQGASFDPPRLGATLFPGLDPTPLPQPELATSPPSNAAPADQSGSNVELWTRTGVTLGDVTIAGLKIAANPVPEERSPMKARGRRGSQEDKAEGVKSRVRRGSQEDKEEGVKIEIPLSSPPVATSTATGRVSVEVSSNDDSGVTAPAGVGSFDRGGRPVSWPGAVFARALADATRVLIGRRVFVVLDGVDQGIWEPEEFGLDHLGQVPWAAFPNLCLVFSVCCEEADKTDNIHVERIQRQLPVAFVTVSPLSWHERKAYLASLIDFYTSSKTNSTLNQDRISSKIKGTALQVLEETDNADLVRSTGSLANANTNDSGSTLARHSNVMTVPLHPHQGVAPEPQPFLVTSGGPGVSVPQTGLARPSRPTDLASGKATSSRPVAPSSNHTASCSNPGLNGWAGLGRLSPSPTLSRASPGPTNPTQSLFETPLHPYLAPGDPLTQPLCPGLGGNPLFLRLLIGELWACEELLGSLRSQQDSKHTWQVVTLEKDWLRVVKAFSVSGSLDVVVHAILDRCTQQDPELSQLILSMLALCRTGSLSSTELYRIHSGQPVLLRTWLDSVPHLVDRLNDMVSLAHRLITIGVRTQYFETAHQNHQVLADFFENAWRVLANTDGYKTLGRSERYSGYLPLKAYLQSPQGLRRVYRELCWHLRVLGDSETLGLFLFDPSSFLFLSRHPYTLRADAVHSYYILSLLGMSELGQVDTDAPLYLQPWLHHDPDILFRAQDMVQGCSNEDQRSSVVVALGLFLRDLGRPKEAGQFLEEWLHVVRRNVDVDEDVEYMVVEFDSDRTRQMELACALINKAQCDELVDRAGRCDWVDTYKKGCESLRVSLGDSHKETLSALVSLSEALLRRWGMHEAATGAVAGLERALSLLKAKVGPSHPSYGVVLRTLGTALAVSTLDFAKGRQVVQEALGVLRGSLGTAHPDFGLGLVMEGTLCTALCGYDEAAVCLHVGLDVLLTTTGDVTLDVMRAVTCLGHVEGRRGRHVSALMYYARAAWVLSQIYGADARTVEVGESLLHIGQAFQEKKDIEPAQRFLQRALEVRVRLRSGLDPDWSVGKGQLALGQVLEARGQSDWEAAQAKYERAVQVFEEAGCREGLDMAMATWLLGKLHMKKRGEEKKGLELLKQSVALLERTIGRDHEASRTRRQFVDAALSRPG